MIKDWVFYTGLFIGISCEKQGSTRELFIDMKYDI